MKFAPNFGSATIFGQCDVVRLSNKATPPPEHDDVRQALSQAAPEHLTKVVKGKHNANDFVRHEAARRGIDKEGNFVGWDNANAIHQSTKSVANQDPSDSVLAQIRLLKNDTLAKVMAGELDLNDLARQEMVARGLDPDGNWVGVDDAADSHKPENQKEEPEETEEEEDNTPQSFAERIGTVLSKSGARSQHTAKGLEHEVLVPKDSHHKIAKQIKDNLPGATMLPSGAKDKLTYKIKHGKNVVHVKRY